VTNISKEPVQLSSSNHGDWNPPGGTLTEKRATVYRLPSGKFKLEIDDKRGSNQGYKEWHFEESRNYRHADLDELMAIALSEEEDKEIRAAIRDAIGDAEDEIFTQDQEAP